jgi:hypothetical protein
LSSQFGVQPVAISGRNQQALAALPGLFGTQAEWIGCGFRRSPPKERQNGREEAKESQKKA